VLENGFAYLAGTTIFTFKPEQVVSKWWENQGQMNAPNFLGDDGRPYVNGPGGPNNAVLKFKMNLEKENLSQGGVPAAGGFYYVRVKAYYDGTQGLEDYKITINDGNSGNYSTVGDPGAKVTGWHWVNVTSVRPGANAGMFWFGGAGNTVTVEHVHNNNGSVHFTDEGQMELSKTPFE